MLTSQLKHFLHFRPPNILCVEWCHFSYKALDKKYDKVRWIFLYFYFYNFIYIYIYYIYIRFWRVGVVSYGLKYFYQYYMIGISWIFQSRRIIKARMNFMSWPWPQNIPTFLCHPIESKNWGRGNPSCNYNSLTTSIKLMLI